MTAYRRICVAGFDVPSCELSSPVLCLDRIWMPEQLLELGLGTRHVSFCLAVRGRIGRLALFVPWDLGFVRAPLSPRFLPASGCRL